MARGPGDAVNDISRNRTLESCVLKGRVSNEIGTCRVNQPEYKHHSSDQRQPAGPETPTEAEGGHGNEHHEGCQLVACTDHSDKQEGHHESAHPVLRPLLPGGPAPPPNRQVGGPEATESAGVRGQWSDEQGDQDEVQEESEGLRGQIVLVLPVPQAKKPEHQPTPSRISGQGPGKHCQGHEPQPNVEHRSPQGYAHRLEAGCLDDRGQEGKETRPVEVRVNVRIYDLRA